MCMSVYIYFRVTKSIFFFNLFVLFIYFWLRWVFATTCRLSLAAARRAGATLHCGARASHCGGFSCCGARALGT